MNGLILKGAKEEKEKYINEFIKKHNIPLYNIYRYNEIFKIGDAREIIRKISISSDANRIFVIAGEMGIESQNALLKTLEELPTDTFIIFSGTFELLPTIISRCSQIFLAGNDNNEALSEEIIKSIEGGNFNKALAQVERYIEEKNIEEFILSLRISVIKSIFLQNDQKALLLSKILREFNSKYSLVSQNNLNVKLLASRIFINSFREKYPLDKGF